MGESGPSLLIESTDSTIIQTELPYYYTICRTSTCTYSNDSYKNDSYKNDHAYVHACRCIHQLLFFFSVLQVEAHHIISREFHLVQEICPCDSAVCYSGVHSIFRLHGYVPES